MGNFAHTSRAYLRISTFLPTFFFSGAVAVPLEDAVTARSNAIAHVNSLGRTIAREPNGAEERSTGFAAADDVDVVLHQPSRLVDESARQFGNGRREDERDEPAFDRRLRLHGHRRLCSQRRSHRSDGVRGRRRRQLLTGGNDAHRNGCNGLPALPCHQVGDEKTIDQEAAQQRCGKEPFAGERDEGTPAILLPFEHVVGGRQRRLDHPAKRCHVDRRQRRRRATRRDDGFEVGPLLETRPLTTGQVGVDENELWADRLGRQDRLRR
jgi:hypothetical protein